MDSGAGSPFVSVNNDGKEEEAKMGMFPCWKGPSFVEVLRSGSVPFVGGSRSRLSATSAETCSGFSPVVEACRGRVENGGGLLLFGITSA
jgi:hypothetical protein